RPDAGAHVMSTAFSRAVLCEARNVALCGAYRLGSLKRGLDRGGGERGPHSYLLPLAEFWTGLPRHLGRRFDVHGFRACLSASRETHFAHGDSAGDCASGALYDLTLKCALSLAAADWHRFDRALRRAVPRVMRPVNAFGYARGLSHYLAEFPDG